MIGNIEWVEDTPFVHRLFIDKEYVGKLHFTVVGDTVESCQFVKSPGHERIPIDMFRLMLLTAKHEVIDMLKVDNCTGAASGNEQTG